MTALQRYLAEEIAEDHADRLVSRREALRRLGLLGLSGATAASLLAGVVAKEARATLRVVPGAAAATSLAIDLLSEEGGTGSFADEFEAMAALGAAPPSRFVADMKAGVTEVRRRLPGKKGRGYRVLLRRRDGVASARLEGVSHGGCRSLLRPLPRGR